MKVNTDILTMATADLADNQEDQGEINYDPTKLPGTRRSHPPVKVLHADLIKGQAAKSEMEKALRITVAMIINELTGPGVSASKLRLDDYWVYDQFATHSLTASNDTTLSWMPASGVARASSNSTSLRTFAERATSRSSLPATPSPSRRRR